MRPPTKEKPMDKIRVAKQIIGIAVGYGTSKIVTGIISSNVTPENMAQKASISAAAFVIGWVASDHAVKFTEDKIDFVIDVYNKAKAKHIIR
jgi:hypothetical protein